ncbi:MAG: helix-turn-helix transcriptional regulator [Butyrivibrio sp.]|nr:helix-turn-helix transcriptional regulator [Butyrivibrio sp.]
MLVSCDVGNRRKRVKRDNPKKKSEAKEFHIQVGKRLQRYRLEAGVTQQALGIRIGRTANTIAEYEAGRTKIPVEVVAKLAKELNFSIDELLFGEQGRMEFVVENQLKKISSKRILLYMKLLTIELERRDTKS